MNEKDTQCPVAPAEVNGRHIYQIPVEWWYDADENIGGDYAKAAIVIQAKHVTKLRCLCGAEVERKIVR